MDPKAQDLTLKYDGGTFTMPVGNLELIFGSDYNDFYDDVEDASVGVRGHSRVRVIGGASTSVQGHTRRYTKWPTSTRTNVGVGNTCDVRWKDSQGWWTGRYTGPAARLADFMNKNAKVPVEFYTSRGTGYGPFNGEIEDGN